MKFSRATSNRSRVRVPTIGTVVTAVAFGFLAGVAFSGSDPLEQHLRFLVSESSDPYQLARTESGGFFTDISEEQWTIKKKIFQMAKATQSRKENALGRLSRYPSHFYTNCYEPEFTCPHEVRLGSGDGGKWICDPHRITSKHQDHEPCLVYSVGVKGDIQFESGMNTHVSSECEIHSFDLNSVTPRGKQVSDVVKNAGGTFHHWGIKATEKMHAGSRSPWKTLKQTIEELGHKNRTIDVLKIDCEDCEWEAVHYWLQDLRDMNVYARQILMEVHKPPAHPGAKLLFEAMQQEGYVIFHKEANSLAKGECYEYAWVRLDLKFQQQE